MNPSNCMYGEAHAGDAFAVRNKVGRSVAWLCARHFKEHEKDITRQGYHLRTLEELQARGELDATTGQTDTGTEDLGSHPTEEPQQSRRDNPSGNQTPASPAHEQPSGNHLQQQHHTHTPGRDTESPRGPNRDTGVQAQTQELEARTPGTRPEIRGLQARTATRGDAGNLDWPAWTEGAGHLSLTPEQREILQAPFKDHDLTIRYDGVVYAPWRKYWSRMVEAFAPYMPAVIPVGNPHFAGSEVMVGVVMVCNGVFIGKAWGSHRLEGANDKMTMGDRVESAISDAISKIGKRLNMGEDLWDEEFRNYWKSQYAIGEPRGRFTIWRKRETIKGD